MTKQRLIPIRGPNGERLSFLDALKKLSIAPPIMNHNILEDLRIKYLPRDPSLSMGRATSGNTTSGSPDWTKKMIIDYRIPNKRTIQELLFPPNQKIQFILTDGDDAPTIPQKEYTMVLPSLPPHIMYSGPVVGLTETLGIASIPSSFMRRVRKLVDSLFETVPSQRVIELVSSLGMADKIGPDTTVKIGKGVDLSTLTPKNCSAYIINNVVYISPKKE